MEDEKSKVAAASTEASTDVVKARTPDWKMMKEKHDPRKKQEVSELPFWVKTAMTRRIVQNLSIKDAAKSVNRNDTTLSRYMSSPAGQTWMEAISEVYDNPVSLAKMVLEEAATEVTLDRFMFLEAAKAAGDYTSADRIAKDLQEKMGIIAKKETGGAIKVEVKLGTSTLEVPTIEAEYVVVGEEEEDDEAV